MSAKSLYDLVGSRPSATPSELRFDYERALAAANRAGATKRMVEIVGAYEVLANPHYRAYYDETGRAVRQERVPNTYGRAVPFRSGGPLVMDVLPSSAANRCQAPSDRFGFVSGRGRLLAALFFAVVVGVGTIAALLVRQPPAPQGGGVLVPGTPGTQQLVQCPGQSRWVPAGVTIACPDGSAPNFVARRGR